MPTETETVSPVSFWQLYSVKSERRRPGTGLGEYYTVSAVVELSGPLRVPVLQRAFRELLRRHDLLRTRVVMDEGPEPFQAVRAAGEGPAEVEVVDEADVLAAEGWLYAPVRQETSPVRVRLARRGPEEHVLSLHLHHLIGDPTTLWGVLGELAALYRAELDGTDVPPPRAQYREYAADEARQSAAGRDAARDWWASSVGAARFASVRLGPPGEPFAFRDELLSPDLVARAGRLARTDRGTLFVVLLAALACAMDPYVAGGDDLVFLTLFERRDRPEWRGMLGPCMVPVYIPVPRPAAGLSADYVRAVRDNVLAARRHCLVTTKEVRLMNPFFHHPDSIIPFFEYIPVQRPAALAFGPVTGRVTDASGHRDTGLASFLSIRARATSTGALAAHLCADGRGWTAPLTREVCRAMGERIGSATRAGRPLAAADGR
ncbi:condensation domain-containing protein [Marinactinospora rubrisoli]|uniref:Condensation domain-containing protein n=1 Tax=Marinactinospora rubrisoli TaxID=2715399 RepID=A0ABW2KKJ0_9ACTN